MIGLLWLDTQKRPLTAEVVQEAVTHCRENRGFTPRLAHVHESALAEETVLAGVKVQPVKSTQMHHLFLVIPEEAQ
jgi:hypothetical protein